MTKDAEKLLRYIVDESKKCNDVEVAVDLNEVNDIPDIRFSKNKLLDELRFLEFISAYEENVLGEINVYLTSKCVNYLNKQQEFERVSKKSTIFVVDGGQVNIASGNATINPHYDIYHTNKMSKNQLPIEITYDLEYVNSLYEHLDSYQSYITKIIRNNSKSIKKIERNINSIKQTLNCYYNGKIREAYDYIKEILIDYVNSPYIVAPINENYAFKGLAPKKIRPKAMLDNEDYIFAYKYMLDHELSFFKARVSHEKLMIKDMLHIPFDKRSLVTTQRFSIPGIPCLYLSTTSFGSWLELGTPEPDIFQVSSFKIPTDLRVLNLCIRWKFIQGMIKLANTKEEKEVIFDFYEIYPLVIATSYHICELNRKFKSEYIISQIGMQVCNELKIDGVAYLSKRITDYYAYPQAVNLAIAVPYNTDLLYWERANEVLITEPIKFSEFCNMKITNQGINQFSTYVNEIYKNSFNNDIMIAGNEMKYTDTAFSAFDEYLVAQKFNRFINLSSENRMC